MQGTAVVELFGKLHIGNMSCGSMDTWERATGVLYLLVPLLRLESITLHPQVFTWVLKKAR